MAIPTHYSYVSRVIVVMISDDVVNFQCFLNIIATESAMFS